MSKHLTQHYREFWPWRKHIILHNVNIQIAQGDCVGLCGPNGAGKTTLLRILVGMERPTFGKVEILGSAPTCTTNKRNIGYMPQETPFPKDRNGQDILFFLAKMHGLTRQAAKQRIALLAEQLCLVNLLARPLKHYSFGMQRRLNFAQTLLHQPAVLFLDEPFTGLDEPGVKILENILEKLVKQGKTILIASHQLPGNENLLSRILQIADGKICETLVANP